MNSPTFNWIGRLQLEELKGGQMMRKVEMERFTVISSKPFDKVVALSQGANRPPEHGGVLAIGPGCNI